MIGYLTSTTLSGEVPKPNQKIATESRKSLLALRFSSMIKL